MSGTKQLRIRFTDQHYETVMAKAKREGISPSRVIQDYLDGNGPSGRTSDRLYGAVLQMKSLVNQMSAKAKIKGIDLDQNGIPVKELYDQLQKVHRLILETNGVDLSGTPQGQPVEPMTLEQELRLEIEHERFYDLGQGDAS